MSAVSLLTMMQTRISFVLPLIGYGAAQQAAKNNGIDYNADGCEVLMDMVADVEDENLYGNEDIAPKYINGYDWRGPYAGMLTSILTGGASSSFYTKASAKGIAVGTDDERLGSPNLYSEGAGALAYLLTMQSFYDAVNGNSWCDLKDVLDQDFSGAWWGKFDCQYNDAFIGQSEILPVHIEYTDAGQGRLFLENAHLETVFPKRFGENGSQTDTLLNKIYMNDAQPYPYTMSDDGARIESITIWPRGTPVTVTYPNIDTYVVEAKDITGTIINPNAKDLIYDVLPSFVWCIYDQSEWQDYDDEQINLWKDYLRAGFRPGYAYYSGATSWFVMSQEIPTLTASSMKGNAKENLKFKNNSAQAKIDETSIDLRDGAQKIKTDALAKPFGRIKDSSGAYKPPHYPAMVLPVFTEVALMPVSLEGHGENSQLDRGWILYLTKFLPILGQSSSLGDAWTKAAEDYPEYLSYFSYYYNALQKISNEEWRKRGLNWLNTPVSYRIESVTGERIPTSYNKDHCNDWPTGGSGGHRAGPGKLH